MLAPGVPSAFPRMERLMMMDDQPDHATTQDVDRDTDDQTLSRLIEHPEADKDDAPASKDDEKSTDEESWPSGFGSFP
ncbi:MAG: hypothetical protein AB7I59_20245 [Geminicoccaceae bacterium]